MEFGFYQATAADYRIRIVGECLGPTTSKRRRKMTAEYSARNH